MARILLVDDDPEVAATNAETIETLGHSVELTSTPAEAAAAVRRETPDLVVLEAIFGGKFTGMELARSLAETHPDLPMIMLTRADEQLSSEELARQDRDGGWLPVNRYLEKPVMDDVLAYEVEHLLPDER
jgi:CheY-like chemotaxis protein